jgi:hypothetical protein
MGQYSDTHKQRQPEGHELNKSELSDADFTGKLLEFYDDTYLDLSSFAELVGYGEDTVASWLGERTPINSGLPSPAERARIVTRLAELVARIKQLVECIRGSLNWLRDRGFSHEWVWKYCLWPDDEVSLSIWDTEWKLSQAKDRALDALERLRCKVKPRKPEHRFSLKVLKQINAMLLGYINRNEDLPGFTPAKLHALCKAKGWSLAELARQSGACVDEAPRISYYVEDSIVPFPYEDVFKVPPITAKYLSEVMFGVRSAINPEVWRVVLRCLQESRGQAAAETGTNFRLEQSSAGCSYDFLSGPQTLAAGLQKAAAEATDCPWGLSDSEIAEGADEAAQEGAALPEGQEQAGSNTAPSDSDSPGRQKRRGSEALTTEEALGSSIRDYLEKVGEIQLLDQAWTGDEEARRLLRQAAEVLRLYREGKLTADEAIEKLWRMRFIMRDHLDKWGIQKILADLLPCAESTVSGSRVWSKIYRETQSDGARRYSEDAQNYDSFRQDDR